MVQRRSCKYCGKALCMVMWSIKPSGTLLIIFGSKSGGGDLRMMCAQGPPSDGPAWEIITTCLRGLEKAAENDFSGCTKSAMSLTWSNSLMLGGAALLAVRSLLPNPFSLETKL